MQILINDTVFGEQRQRINESFKTVNTVYFTNEIAMIIGIPTFVENLVAFLAILKCKDMIVQIRSLLLCLSIADCLTGLVLVIPDFVYELAFTCRIKKYLGATITFASILTVSLLNLDRCLALFFGIRYYTKVTDVKVKLSCLLLWMLALVNSYLMYLDPSQPTGIYCSPIYASPDNFATTLARLNYIFFVFLNVVFLGFILYQIPKRGTSKVLARMLIITGCALVCYSPGLILHAFYPIQDGHYRKLIAYTGVLAFCNSMLNPILYVWRFKETRYNIKKIICFCNNGYLTKLGEEWKEKTATFQIKTISTVEGTSLSFV